MIPNLVRHDEWFDLSGSVFLEFVVREVERENCENNSFENSFEFLIFHSNFGWWWCWWCDAKVGYYFREKIRAKSDLFFNRPKRCF